MLRSSLPGIGLSAAVVAVTLAIYSSSSDDPRQPTSAAVEGPASPLTLPPALTTRGPLPVTIGQGGDGRGGDGGAGGSILVPVAFTQPAALPAAPRPLGGARSERPNRGDDRRDRRSGKRGDKRGNSKKGGNQRQSPVLPVARSAQPPTSNGKPKPHVPRPSAPARPTPPGQAKRAAGKPVPPGQAKTAAPPAPAPAPAPAPRAVPHGHAKKQAAAPAPAAAPAGSAPAPAAPPAAECAPAGNGNGKAKGRC